jgi:hypothetical protein
MAFTKIVSPGIDTTGSYTVQELNTVGVATAGTVQVGSATTIHTTGIDLGSGNITSHNINSTGIITATSFVGPVTGNITGDITATSGTFSGNVSIGGTLTYEDVTNIDSVGIITAQSDISIADKIVHTGDTNTAIRFPADDTITAETGGTERLRIDSSGRLLINKTTNRDQYYGGSYTGSLQVEGTSDSTRLTQFIHNANAASQPIVVLGKSRGTSVGSYTVVQNGDYLGTLSFQGSDGDEMIEGARIDAIVSAAPGADDMPTALTFGTTADGASSPTERLRITAGGKVEIGSNGNYGNSPATLNIGSRASNIQGTVAIARGEALGGGTGPLLSLVHGPDGGTQRTHQIYSFVGDLRIVADSNENMEFHTGGSESLRINSSGEVSIGTVSGGKTLTLYGASSSSFRISKSGVLAYDHTFDGSSYTIANNNGSAGIPIIIGTKAAGGESLRIDPSGRLLKSGQAAITSTSLSHSIQVAAASDANAIAIIGRAADDIGELSFYEADKSTKLGELQYRQDHLNLRCRVGDIRFASGGVSETLRIDGSGRIAQGERTPTNHGSPNLLLWGADTTLHLTSTGSTANTSFAGIKFAVAGGSTGDYSKAGIFAKRIASYNDLDLLFCFNSANDATGTSTSGEMARIRNNGKLYLGPYKSAGQYGTVSQNIPYKIGVSPYGWANGGDIAEISMGAHVGTGQDDGQIVFKTATNVHSDATGLVERLRIDENGDSIFYGNPSIDSTDVYYKNEYGTGSWSSSNWYTVVPHGLTANCTYLVSLVWDWQGSNGQPYYLATQQLYSTCNGTNGTGSENELTPMVSTHTGGTGARINCRVKAQASGTPAMQVNLSFTTAGNSWIRVKVWKMLFATRSS